MQENGTHIIHTIHVTSFLLSFLLKASHPHEMELCVCITPIMVQEKVGDINSVSKCCYTSSCHCVDTLPSLPFTIPTLPGCHDCTCPCLFWHASLIFITCKGMVRGNQMKTTYEAQSRKYKIVQQVVCQDWSENLKFHKRPFHQSYHRYTKWLCLVYLWSYNVNCMTVHVPAWNGSGWLGCQKSILTCLQNSLLRTRMLYFHTTLVVHVTLHARGHSTARRQFIQLLCL